MMLCGIYVNGNSVSGCFALEDERFSLCIYRVTKAGVKRYLDRRQSLSRVSNTENIVRITDEGFTRASVEANAEARAIKG